MDTQMDMQAVYGFFIFLGVVLPIVLLGCAIWLDKLEKRQEEKKRAKK